MNGYHMSRRWHGGDKEWFGAECVCEEAPCSFVVPNEDCPQHGMWACKTIRSAHAADDCPGKVEA